MGKENAMGSPPSSRFLQEGRDFDFAVLAEVGVEDVSTGEK
jgi:hypothetical protein